MIRLACGQPLRIKQKEIALKGCAIEMRINAEDPDRDFFPSPGTVEALSWPTGPGIRIDSCLYTGYKMPPFYDSLVAKLIVWDEDREYALKRAGRALDEFHLEGFSTTASLHRRLVEDPAVKEGF